MRCNFQDLFSFFIHPTACCNWDDTSLESSQFHGPFQIAAMSSMFKKKGGPAFKPKIPSARARPAAPAHSQPAKPPQSQPSSVDAQPQPQSQSQQPTVLDPEKKTFSTTTVAGSSDDALSQKPSRVPRQESSAETPPPVSEAAKPTSVPAAEPPSDKPKVPDAASTIYTKMPVEEPATVGPAVADEPDQAQTQSHDRVLPDADASPSDSRTVTPSTEAPTPIADARPDAGTTKGSSTPISTTPGESSDAQAKPASKPRTRRATTKAAAAADAETGEGEESARPKKRQRKVPTAQDAAAAVDAPSKLPRKRRTPGEGAQARRRARSVTPEDSENQVVDLQQLRMSDLTRDLHIGKKFSRHDELRERERRARLRLKAKAGVEDNQGNSKDGSATPSSSEPGAKEGSPADAATPTTTTPPDAQQSAEAPASGPQFRIVDGQIVIDQSSLAVDRHARAAARLGDMETVEENDFTRLITSNSFMSTSKLKGPNIWTDAETELFYRGLRMFGTDFEIIAKMFPSKQRRHVKLKYNREERHCPRRITAAVTGEKTVRMDLEEYKAFTGATFEPVATIEAEQRKIQEDFEAEQKRIADEQEEVMRKKREELFADDDEDMARKKKAAKKGKGKVIYGLNGEPIRTEE